MKPLVSIITVCYNAAGTLAATLDSVRAQTWRPLESVVVDGGSKDGTQAIVARYADVTSTVVSEPDTGIYDAMNKGIGLARGEIIHFLNADDSFVDEGVVEAAVRVFMAEPEVDLVFGDAVYRTTGGNLLRQFKRVNARNLLYGDLCHQVVFVRKCVFERFGKFNLDYRINADYDWMLRVFRGGAQVRYLSRAIVNYDASGLSSRDLDRMHAERYSVQRQFAGGVRLALGLLTFRAVRRLRGFLGEVDFAKTSCALSLRQMLEADITRYGGSFSFWQLIKILFLNPAFRPVVTLRLCQAANSAKAGRKLFLPLLKVLHQFAKRSAGIDLPWRTSIGPGLLVAHGYGLVINENAVIGSNVTLFHGVTLGRRDRIAEDGGRNTGYPILEDDVWCGPHAIIVGGIKIGKGSRIAGGAFVTNSIPPSSLVVGNPSQIVKSNVASDVINRAQLWLYADLCGT